MPCEYFLHLWKAGPELGETHLLPARDYCCATCDGGLCDLDRATVVWTPCDRLLGNLRAVRRVSLLLLFAALCRLNWHFRLPLSWSHDVLVQGMLHWGFHVDARPISLQIYMFHGLHRLIPVIVLVEDSWINGQARYV